MFEEPVRPAFFHHYSNLGTSTPLGNVASQKGHIGFICSVVCEENRFNFCPVPVRTYSASSSLKA